MPLLRHLRRRRRLVRPARAPRSPAHEFSPVVARAISPAHELFGRGKPRLAPRPSSHEFFSVVASCGLLPGPAHELFGSRKLRLAPQDYSPWTPPSDRLSGRSYPPASRHSAVLDLVGSALDRRGADGKSPGHALLPRMRASYGPKSGPKAGSRASSPGEQAAACDYRKKLVRWGRGGSRSLRLPKNSCAGLIARASAKQPPS
jgi:hypothetical protein